MIRSRFHSAPLLALFFFGLAVTLPAGADTTPQTLPFTQNWTNTGLITAANDWTGVPGIVGKRGDGLAGGNTGVDPQTIVAADDPGVLNVQANQTNPNTNTTGGLAEFDTLVNPVVAFQGSGTAQAPYLLITLNTTGFVNINVAYNLRDVDGSADNSTQQVALQFRVGTSGAFTNVPAGYVADASGIGATLVTPVSTLLPAAANNQPVIQVRIMTSNAPGNDEWIGVDDINITGGAAGNVLSIDDVSLPEGNAGTTTFNFTVSLSAPAPAGGVTFDIATQDGTATLADNDYVQNTMVGQTIPMGSQTFPFSVTVNGDTTPEANETFFVNVTNVVGTGITVADGQGKGTIQNDDLFRINQIQGSGTTSPVVGAAVTTHGIVTALRTNGFFVQSTPTDDDGDPNTSEGIFVFTSAAPPAQAVIGNDLQLSATVQEFVPSQDPLSPPVTELISPSGYVVNSTGNPLPGAVTILLSDTLVNSIENLEKYEGMRVHVDTLTTSGPTLGTIDEVNATSTSTGVFHGVFPTVARPFREPGIQANDPAPAGSGVTICPTGAPTCVPRFDLNPERIRVNTTGQVGGTALDVTAGVTVSNITGVLDYQFRTWQILTDPGVPILATPNGSGTAVANPNPSEFTVATVNCQRFFNTSNDGTGEPVLTATAFANRLKKMSLAIRDFTKTPDIIGVEEMESLSTLTSLANQINTDAGGSNPMYVPYLVEGNDVGGIDVGFLVKTAPVVGGAPRVTVNAVVQEGKATTFLNPDLSTALLNDRPPLRLMAVVSYPGGTSLPVTVYVIHNRSLSSVDSMVAGTNGWPTEGDRVRNKRRAQAEFVANLIQGRQMADPTERIVAVGDYNTFEFSDGYADCLGTIMGTPTPAGQVTLASADLVNPDLVNLDAAAAPSERYSFSFDGNAQSLDHILVNAPLVSSTTLRRIEHARINSDFPEGAIYRNDPNRAERISDHDPGVAFFCVDLALSITFTGSSSICPTADGGSASLMDFGTSTGFQWGYRTVSGSGGLITNISGATTSSYTLHGPDFPGVNTYFLVLQATSNCGTSLVSPETTVTVAADGVGPTVTAPAGATVTQTLCQ